MTQDEVSADSSNDLDDRIRSSTEPSWAVARSCMATIGPVPSLFSTSIRTINKIDSVVNSNDGQVRALAVQSAEFLVKISPSLKATFYFAACGLHREETAKLERPTVRGILNLFDPREIAGILALSFCFRRLRTRVPPDDWVAIADRTLVLVELGGLIGKHMRLIGAGTGMLLGGVRPLSQGALAAIDPKTFVEYRRKLKASAKPFDLDRETAMFGCNHLQIATYLTQELGFGTPRSLVSMSLGMDALKVDPANLPARLRDHLASCRAAMHFLEQCVKTSAPPSLGESVHALILSEEEQAQLNSNIQGVLANGATMDFLTKERVDIPGALYEGLGITGLQSEIGT